MNSINSEVCSAAGSNRYPPPDFESVADFGNLVLAFRKASTGKKKRDDIARFSMHWESGLLDLRQNLLDGSYRPGGYKLFTVHEKKTRLIMAAPFIDRIVHHAICNLLDAGS